MKEVKKYIQNEYIRNASILQNWKDVRVADIPKLSDTVHLKGVRFLNRIDKRLFFLSPSFYALLSGALIGAGINLLTGLLFAQNLMMDKTFIILAIIFLLVSSGLFAWISLVLEELRSEAKGGVHLLRMIQDMREVLYPLAIGSLASFIISMFFLYFAMV